MTLAATTCWLTAQVDHLAAPVAVVVLEAPLVDLATGAGERGQAVHAVEAEVSLVHVSVVLQQLALSVFLVFVPVAWAQRQASKGEARVREKRERKREKRKRELWRQGVESPL